ncbi:cofactor assembly of complex C subunit B [Desertifilum sp. FACHB-1129]|uniref:Cofactor assembly of complex C subunit B n=2 Tax=Desertifilum tharense IPPAS B-1220 TaxID=1781255 RepID=A0A1E5QE20_9CYAN|nr:MULTISPECIES: cofactor assembly of complex C subunit B [Desertifilum]MDA0209045.1 cofactor assembly of complex C subunit B [Cyanobacteria bacterium FC1]MDI9635531.1 cofactor assembly of complex C subunit B [Geitlerinema splendidum]MDL5044908.1 cofactor assembly of complex C subunit B [Oscillatoria amoena NRMC-F 0135]MBD2310527.1 cofactor assembly of complex C subunit B [Desertifilum sp. FACHB-1129]MBD2321979.1 cofactor assembly of complex C subunit B [Desertifilum sp. FACHB-866]
MSNAVLNSTFLLTLLLLVGLFFFIRASVKDRTQQVTLLAEETEESVLAKLQDYFSQRSYRVTNLDAEQNQVTFEGFVRPSGFLAFFLTVLAFVGLLCLSLVLSVLFPQFQGILLSLVLISPVAGVFYWKKAGRTEQVLLKLEAVADSIAPKNRITVTAHRDELLELQRSLGLKTVEAESQQLRPESYA